MKELLFIGHDPGGYDALKPVYEACHFDGTKCRLLLSGPAAKKEPIFSFSDSEIMESIKSCAENGNLLALLTGTSWHSEIELMAISYCNNLGIKTVSILDYWSNYKERFLLKDRYIFPTYLFVMDKMAYEEAIASGVPSEIMKIVGQPGLDYYVNKKVVGVSNKRILFLSQPISDLYGEKEGYTEFTVFEDILKAGKELGFGVSIKFHPKDNLRMRELYKHYEVQGALEDICSQYQLVIGMTTMGLLQCALMGAVVLNYEPGLIGTEKSIVKKLGITKGAYSYNELLEHIKAPPPVEQTQYPEWFSGKSTERCVQELKHLIF